MEREGKYIIISVAAFIVYCNTLWGDFVFDDSEAILKNKDVMPFTPLIDIFKNDFWGMDISLNSSHKSYRPLTILSYRLNVIYSRNKLDAFQFHATNLVLYGLLCQLTIPTFELFLKRRKHEYVHELAYLSSLLFTVHPVHTESVAALVGRADILSSILFLISLLLYHGIITKGSFKMFIFFVISVVSAVLCKETSITVLGMCSLYDCYYGKRERRKWRKIFTPGFFFRNFLLFVIGSIILYYRFKVMNFEGPLFTNIDNPAAFSDSFFTRIMTYNYLYFLNFLLLVWPQWLCFDWSMGCIPLIVNFCDIRIIYVVIFWIFVICSLVKLFRRVREANNIDARVMGIFLAVLPFIPAANIFFTVGFVIAERTLLLPSAGFAFLVVIGYIKIENKAKNKQRCRMVFYALIFIFGARSILRNSEWLKEEKLFTRALSVCPLNAKVHYNVAKIAADKNKKNLALREYKIALKLNPVYEQAMNNLANLLREDDKFKEAEKLLRKAVKVRPNFAAAWMNLGIVLTNLNNTEEAEHSYKTAIMHRNKYPDCYYNLGNLYLEQNRNEEALKAWEMAVLYRPSHVAAWSNTLVLLDTMGQFDEVQELGRTALMHNPTAPAIHFTLGNTYGKIQVFEKAEAHFLEAINLSNGENALYHSNLGVLYHRWDKIDKARSMYQKALKIDPNLKSAEINLKKLQNQKIESKNN